MRRIVEIAVRPMSEGAPSVAPDQPTRLLAPKPFDHWGQRFVRFEAEEARIASLIRAENSNCEAFVLDVAPDAAPTLRYVIDEIPAEPAPSDWVWRVQTNRHTTAAPSLVDAARALCAGADCQHTALRRLIDDAAELFGYGHVAEEDRFNAGEDAVPTVCGTTKGSCVDINTYLLAAARSVGIRGQYVAGYWFHPHKTATDDMHCWLAFEPDGALTFWDLAHALKWGDSLGARIEEGLNPAGGRRVAMSCGRGLQFDPWGRGAERAVEISHFSEPVYVPEDGRLIEPPIRAHLCEVDAAEAAA